MKRISLIVLCALMAVLLAAAAYAYDDIQLPGTNTPPVIDAKLDDCYVKIHDFYSPNEDEWYDNADFGHDAKGEAWGTWDADNFYAFFKIAEEDYFPQNGEADPPGSNYSSMYLSLLATLPVNDLPENDLYVMQCSFNRSIEDTKEWKYTGSVVEQYRDNSGAYAIYDTCPFDFEVSNDGTWTYYEVKMPWDQIDRTGQVSFTEGHQWFFNYIITWMNDSSYNTVQYGQGLMNDIYDMGGIVTLVAAPAGSGAPAAPTGRATVEKGADGSLQIPKTASPLVMDGQIDDGYAKLSDFYGMDGFRTDYDADKSISGTAYTAWDDNNFYMLLDVLTPEYEPIFDVQAIDMGIGPAGYVALLGTADGTWTDDQRFEIGIALADEDIQVWKVCSPADIKDSSADNLWFDECPYKYAVRRDAETNHIYYEFGIPWSFLDRTEMLTYKEGSQFILNYAANVHTTTDYSNGNSHLVEFGGGIWAGSYTDGAVVTLVGGSGASAPAGEAPSAATGNWTNKNFTASFDDPDWHADAQDIEFEDTWVAGESNARCNDGSYYVYLKNDGLGDYSVEFEVKEDGTYEIAICLMAWEKSVPRATNVKVDDSDWVRLEFDYENEDKQLEQFITGLTIPLTKGTHKLTLGLPDGHDDSTLKTLYFDYFFFRKVEGAGAPAAAEPASEAAELLAKSWDTIFVDYEMMVDGNAGGWLADNPVEGPIEQVELRGWAHVSTPIKGFAYTIDGGEAVRSEDFIQDRPDVKAVIHEEAEGFDMSIELDKLAVGDHVIKIYAIDANDNLVDTTFEFPFVKEAPPSKGLATVEDAAKGKNIIKNYEFVSGTNGFGGEGPENLWDGNTGTKFCTNEFPAESVAKLDGVYKITGFTMATANDNADYNGRSPNAWTISVSPDGENWTELKKGDDGFFEELNFTYFAGDGKADNVGYVKFSADGTASGTFQVSEVTLFGDKTGDAAPAEEPAAEEPAAEEPKAETPAADNKPAETAKSGCGSMIGGGMIVLVTVLGSAWISKRR